MDKTRGAQTHVNNKFLEYKHEVCTAFKNYCVLENEEPTTSSTTYTRVFPKTFVNKVQSPDIGMQYSANPYQGCEHGCVYCYARNTHEYWGFGAGKDFEKQILYKANAPELLNNFLKHKQWAGHTIVLSGNTDCYQPIERKLQITRQCLEVFLKWQHPVGIITKNALILRDLDILKALAKKHCVSVTISVTTLNDHLRRVLEPRTATIKKRLEAIRKLSEAGIPVRVMVAPIIPGLTSHEILPLVKTVAAHGAQEVLHTVVRLNGHIATIFTDWVEKAFPDRAQKIINQIKACHSGSLNDSRWRTRMRGDGVLADQIALTMALARKKYLKNIPQITPLESKHYRQLKNPQQRLF